MPGALLPRLGLRAGEFDKCVQGSAETSKSYRTRIGIDHTGKPGPAAHMIGGIRLESVFENIDVGKYHGAFIISSLNPDIEDAALG